MGGCLTAEFQKEAYPDNYSKALAHRSQPTNLIASRLGALRAMHRQGVTKVKIPTRQEQKQLEYLKAEMRGEEQKVENGGHGSLGGSASSDNHQYYAS